MDILELMEDLDCQDYREILEQMEKEVTMDRLDLMVCLEIMAKKEALASKVYLEK